MLYSWIKQAARDAGIDDVHPHTVRATTATVLAESGGSARDIQRLLGHSSLAITERYIASTRTSRARTIGLL
jgi:integrase/recombinase XerC